MNVTPEVEDAIITTKRNRRAVERRVLLDDEEEEDEDEDDTFNKPKQRKNIVLEEEEIDEDTATDHDSKTRAGVRTVMAIFDHFGEDKSNFAYVQTVFVQYVAKKFREDKLLKLRARFFVNREFEQKADRDYYALCGFKRDIVSQDFIMVL